MSVRLPVDRLVLCHESLCHQTHARSFILTLRINPFLSQAPQQQQKMPSMEQMQAEQMKQKCGGCSSLLPAVHAPAYSCLCADYCYVYACVTVQGAGADAQLDRLAGHAAGSPRAPYVCVACLCSLSLRYYIYGYVFLIFGCLFCATIVSRIAIVKPEKARAIEDMVIQMAQRGQLAAKIDEEKLIDLLARAGETEEKQRTKVTVRLRRLFTS